MTGVAERAYRRAASLAPGDPEALLELGRFLFQYGRSEEGRALLERVASAPSPFAHAARRLLDP